MLGILACSSERIEPVLFYRAPISLEQVEAVSAYMKQMAEANNYRLFEKDPKQMETLTEGKKAFFLSFYYRDNPILSVTNVGVGEVLTLSLHDYGDLPLDQLTRLAEQAVSGLKAEFGIDLVATEP